MPSRDDSKEPEKAQASGGAKTPGTTGVKVASNEDEALADAALAKLSLVAQHTQASSKDLKEEAASSSQSKSVEEAAKPSPTANSSAARQDEARKMDDCGGLSKAEGRKARRGVNIGFTPHDFPLSSTDEEAEDPIKEREARTHRARKKQLKLHLADSIDASWPADWSLIYAQARIIEIKWIADDMSTIRNRVRRTKTSWFEEMPHSRWMGEAFQRLQAIQEMYRGVEMLSGKEEKGVKEGDDDQVKAKFLAGYIAKELGATLSLELREGLREEGIDGPSEVGGLEVVRGLDGEVEVRVRKREGATGGVAQASG